MNSLQRVKSLTEEEAIDCTTLLATGGRWSDITRTMKSLLKTLALFLMAGLLCSGCVIYHETDSPGAKGVVLDSRSRSPIQGAEVAVSQSFSPSLTLTNALAELRPPTVITDQAGQFSVPAERSLIFGFILVWWPSMKFGETPRGGTLVLRRDGYESATIPFYSASVTNLGEVLMKPTTQ